MKHLLKLIVVASFINLLASCSDDDKQKTALTFTNDFEYLRGWSGLNVRYSKIAHSGYASNIIDTINPYGINFENQYKNISLGTLKKLTVRAWVYFTEKNCKGQIVVAAGPGGGQPTKMWNGIILENTVLEPKTWTKIESSIDIPATLGKDDYFSIYGWCNGKYAIYLDDVEIEFTDNTSK